VTAPVGKQAYSYLFQTRGARVPGYMNGGWPSRKLIEQAKCRLGNSGAFTSRSSIAYTRAQELQQQADDQVARKICNGTPACPVRQRCLLWALQSGTLGVAGGTIVTNSMIMRYRRGRKTARLRREARRATEAT
jgi:hypothetical protein